MDSRVLRRGRVSRAAWVLLIAATATVLQLSVPAAQAHVVYGNQVVAEGQGFCAQDYSEISDGGGHGYAKVGIATNSDGPSWTPCYFRRPAWVFQQAILGVIYFWDGVSGSWQPCFGSDWTIRNDSQQVNRSWSGVAYSCGTSWYTTAGYAYARGSSGAEWIGGGILSGNSGGEYYHWASA